MFRATADRLRGASYHERGALLAEQCPIQRQLMIRVYRGNTTFTELEKDCIYHCGDHECQHSSFQDYLIKNGFKRNGHNGNGDSHS